MDENKASKLVIGAAIEVHRIFGPGLLESAYASALAVEFALRKIPFEKEKELPVIYKGRKLDTGFRADFLVGGNLIVEIKAVQVITEIHFAQVMNYLKLSNCKLGLLLNFNVKYLRDGIRRVANDLPESENVVERVHYFHR